jgi:hypothetical protein
MKKKYGVFFGFAVLLIAVLFTLTGCGDKDSGDPTGPSEDDPPETKIYSVTIGTLTYGTIVANPTSGIEGTEISLTVTPGSGYQLKAGTLRYGTTAIDETTKKFDLPASDVTVTAEFEYLDKTIEKTIEVFLTYFGVTDISPYYGSTLKDIHIDPILIVGIYKDVEETQSLTMETEITENLKLYAKQSVWDEIIPGDNNVIAAIFRGGYTVDKSSSEYSDIKTLILGECGMTFPDKPTRTGYNFRTKYAGNIMENNQKIGEWHYLIYGGKIKEGFIYTITDGKTELFMGENANNNSNVLSQYYVSIDLRDMSTHAWGIYAIKN